MYIGRIVCVGQNLDGRLCAMYRVSSRSFPNRTAVVSENKVVIVPKKGHEGDLQKNFYIAYTCARIGCGDQVAVLSNGSQTDPIFEKIEQGVPPRDALALVNIALDYEKDDYNTPRVSAVVDMREGAVWLSTVRHDGVEVRKMPIEKGRHFYVATYEENGISLSQSGDFDAKNADEACDFILSKGIFAERLNPVSAVSAIYNGSGFDLAAKDFGNQE